MRFASVQTETVGAQVPPDLVIFDCDGVLVDSEVISNRIFAESLAELGGVLTLEETMTFGIGKSATTLAAAIEREFNVTLPPGFIEGRRARIMDAFTRELRPIDGIFELLSALKLKRCVASNSHIDRVRHAFTTTGLMPHLEHISIPPRWSRGGSRLRTYFSTRLGSAAFDRNDVS
ncbi:MAG TPA: HAD hydrolase-like protein [Nitrolancea sp.]|nr:HAD hydrolase-like protein [Nitrolancea sp.]